MWDTLGMEFAIGLLGAIVAVVIPVYIQRVEHPRRQIRYSLVLATPDALPSSDLTFRVLVWSAGRADVPSALFDAGKPIVFHFDTPVTVIENTFASAQPVDYFELRTPSALLISAHLLHHDFSAEITLRAPTLPQVLVDNPLIDVRITRDIKVEKSPAPARQDRAVARSRARARVSLMRISVWLIIVTTVMVIGGSALTIVNNGVGTGIAAPGLIVFPIAVVMLIVAALRRFIAYLRRRGSRTNNT